MVTCMMTSNPHLSEFENELLALRNRREAFRTDGVAEMDVSAKEDLPKEKDRVGLTEVGVFDGDFYSGEKSKFEGYHTSLAVTDDVEVSEKTSKRHVSILELFVA